MTIVMVAVLLLGATNKPAPKVADEIRARAFVLVDINGKTRAVLAGADENAYLATEVETLKQGLEHLSDKQGIEHLSEQKGLSQKDTVEVIEVFEMLRLKEHSIESYAGENGKPAYRRRRPPFPESPLSDTTGGGPRLVLVDTTGVHRAMLSLDAWDTPNLDLLNRHGGTQVSLRVLEGVGPALVLRDEDGKERVSLDFRATGIGPSLDLFDKGGGNRASLSLTDAENGRPVLGLIDQNGKGRAVLGLLPDGRPVHVLMDDKGKGLWGGPPEAH